MLCVVEEVLNGFFNSSIKPSLCPVQNVNIIVLKTVSLPPEMQVDCAELSLVLCVCEVVVYCCP